MLVKPPVFIPSILTKGFDIIYKCLENNHTLTSLLPSLTCLAQRLTGRMMIRELPSLKVSGSGETGGGPGPAGKRWSGCSRFLCSTSSLFSFFMVLFSVSNEAIKIRGFYPQSRFKGIQIKTALYRKLCLFHGYGSPDRKGRQGRTNETGLACQ